MITAAVLRARSKIARLKNNLTMLTEKMLLTSMYFKVLQLVHLLKSVTVYTNLKFDK